MKTRRDPIAPVEAGHAAATLCHLGSLTLDLRTHGQPYAWDPAAERFTSAPTPALLAAANGRLDRGAAG